MRCTLSLLVLFSLCGSLAAAETSQPGYQKLQLSDKFYCEGAYYADFNRDGKPDVVSGPYWYAGPDFEQRHEIREPKEFDPHGYSDNFFSYTDDFNGDGWADVLCIPMPGEEALWYENPAGEQRRWQAHPALKNVGNESPAWADVTGDGRAELVYNIDGFLGYGVWDPEKPDRPWTFHPISTKGDYQRFTHGLGVGDVNGDGRVDILERVCWWEQPSQPEPGQPWIRHDYPFADAAAQMLVYDFDGDGLNDVVNSWHCHHYGLVWHQQVRDEQGQIDFQKHVILPPEPDLNSSGLRISQMHACTLADIDGDGLQDVVTGKRFWAHGPNGDKEPGAPAVLYWFELQRDPSGAARFIPHKIDDDSGVGTQVAATDLNGDQQPDIIVGNKKGSFLFLSQSAD